MSTNQKGFVEAMAHLGNSMGHPEVDQHMELKAAAEASLRKQLEEQKGELRDAIEEGKKPGGDSLQHPDGAGGGKAAETSSGDSPAHGQSASTPKGESQGESQEEGMTSA